MNGALHRLELRLQPVEGVPVTIRQGKGREHEAIRPQQETPAKSPRNPSSSTGSVATCGAIDRQSA